MQLIYNIFLSLAYKNSLIINYINSICKYLYNNIQGIFNILYRARE
jgi:hypothetical protein